MTCNCTLFEFRGILCRHAITVLKHKKVYNILDKYILIRWRKDIKVCHTRVNIAYNSIIVKGEAKQFEKMCNVFYEVADLAVDYELKCTRVMEWIDGIKGILRVENDGIVG